MNSALALLQPCFKINTSGNLAKSNTKAHKQSKWLLLHDINPIWWRMKNEKKSSPGYIRVIPTSFWTSQASEKPCWLPLSRSMVPFFHVGLSRSLRSLMWHLTVFSAAPRGVGLGVDGWRVIGVKSRAACNPAFSSVPFSPPFPLLSSGSISRWQ